jgi:ribosomal protein S27AE
LANETTAIQRSYRAPCPGCGAPVNFLSAQSTHAVCGYCQSTVVRNGETLARIGKMAELFDDHSPLQLQASGVWTQGDVKKPFTLVGRLQYKYGEGTWAEWHAVLMDGTSAYLSEDNGAYVFTTPLESRPDIPEPSVFKVGSRTRLNGKPFSVASNQAVTLISAQGELPRLPQLGKPFAMVELRGEGTGAIGRVDGEVLSIDYGSNPPTLSIGSTVLLEDLQLSGLREESAKDEKARQFACPNCGAQVAVTLDNSKSITCGACNSLIDLTSGVGGELKSAIQNEPVQPTIKLGTAGQLQGVQWQVVGFQHRMGTDPTDPDEHFGWDEYLLYNRKRGFNFLVDATDGWSLVKPTTGAPVMAEGGKSATYLGVRYQVKENYSAETTYVAGEFYWQVTRGQKTDNRDFFSGKSMLSMEKSPNEVTWSVGSQIDSDAVAKAFKLDDKKDLLKRADAKPGSALSGMGCLTIIILFAVIVFFLFLMSRCTSCNPNTENCSSSSSSGSGSSRSSGGSFGGFSGGGGHK